MESKAHLIANFTKQNHHDENLEFFRSLKIMRLYFYKNDEISKILNQFY